MGSIPSLLIFTNIVLATVVIILIATMLYAVRSVKTTQEQKQEELKEQQKKQKELAQQFDTELANLLNGDGSTPSHVTFTPLDMSSLPPEIAALFDGVSDTTSSHNPSVKPREGEKNVFDLDQLRRKNNSGREEDTSDDS